MKPGLKSLLVGAVLGGLLGVGLTLAFESSGDQPCSLHVKNVGTNTITIHPDGGHLPFRFVKRFGFLLLPQRTQYFGVLLTPGQSQSLHFGAGATITLYDSRDRMSRPHAVWTGTSQNVVAEVNAEDITNIIFHITSETR